MKGEEDDRKRDGKTPLNSGQEWNLPTHLGQQKQGKVEWIFCKVICGAPKYLARP
ncbi:MAG: hypothetical protein AB2693_33210 [Candidatus Thiodiazotropha sp.]